MKISAEAWVSIAIAVMSSTAFVYSTFATVKYVDDKHMELKEIVGEIRADQKDTKGMVIDLYKDALGREPRVTHGP